MLRDLRLYQLISPALPIGGFTYSQGLEWAVETGLGVPVILTLGFGHQCGEAGDKIQWLEDHMSERRPVVPSRYGVFSW